MLGTVETGPDRDRTGSIRPYPPQGISRLEAPVCERQDVPPSTALTGIPEIELSQPLPILTAFDENTQMYHKHVLCLIRLHTQPLGTLQFSFASDELLPQDYAPAIWHTFQCTILD